MLVAAAVAMPTLPEIGFELTLRQAVTNSPQSKVTSSEMKSFRVDEKDGRTSLVWRGHPLCGDGFTVTAELTPTPENDGWAYSFRYAGNESGLHIRDIWFPAVTVARTDTTELFLPRDCGMIRRPDWKKAKGGADVGKNGIHGIHFMAALNGTDESWYMDQRGIRPSRRFSIPYGGRKTGAWRPCSATGRARNSAMTSPRLTLSRPALFPPVAGA